MHCDGLGGLPKDRAKAAALFQRSADQDYAPAMINLALLHEHGQGGLAKDPARAKQLRPQVIAQAEAGDVHRRHAGRAV